MIDYGLTEPSNQGGLTEATKLVGIPTDGNIILTHTHTHASVVARPTECAVRLAASVAAGCENGRCQQSF